MELKNIIVGLVLAASLLGITTKAVAEPLEIKPEPSFEQEIKRIFGDKSEIALAVFKHESANGTDLKNYNCYYYNSNGHKYSTFCKKEDIPRAWSVDCGVAQINVKGNVCPSELMTTRGQIEAIERIYKSQGLGAWISYKNGKYKEFL